MPDAADVFITLLEIPPQNFCFGNGQAQFADRLPAKWWRAAGGQRARAVIYHRRPAGTVITDA